MYFLINREELQQVLLINREEVHQVLPHKQGRGTATGTPHKQGRVIAGTS
jgi:hypothetical protein